MQRLFSDWIVRCRARAYDTLVYSPMVRNAAAFGMRARAAFERDPEVKVGRLCQCARLTTNERVRRNLETAIAGASRSIDGRAVDWSNVVPRWRTDRIEKAAILKRYVGEREKGVILISFEYQWVRLLGIQGLEEFARQYTVVLIPSSSPPHGLVHTLFPIAFPAPVFLGISNTGDISTFQAFSGNTVVVPLYASSWIHAGLFCPGSGERDIDILMVANFAPVKRHFAFFQALKSMPESLRVVLAGQPDRGYTSGHIQRLAAAYGVAGRFELLESVPYGDVARLFQRARISLVLSRREGSSMTIAESLISGTPAAIYEDSIIGSRAFINSSTGRFLHHEDLAGQLIDFLANAGSYSPREWMIENGADCLGSSRKLNAILQQHALAAGEKWTEDIAPLFFDPDPMLVSEADRARLGAERRRIQERFGVDIGRG